MIGSPVATDEGTSPKGIGTAPEVFPHGALAGAGRCRMVRRRGFLVRRFHVAFGRRFVVVRPPCVPTAGARSTVTGLGPAGMLAKLLPAAFKEILKGRSPLGVLPEIGEGLLLRGSTTRSAGMSRHILMLPLLPVTMAVAPPGRRVGIAGRPRRRVSGRLGMLGMIGKAFIYEDQEGKILWKQNKQK